jgi:opacity protein-like surface antigen
MMAKVTWVAALCILAGPAAWAQDERIELGATAGWVFSDGVSGTALRIPGVGTFDRVDPKDSFSWGARVGVMATENVEVGALFNWQMSQLQLDGSDTVELGDMSVYNYHGYIAYNFGDVDSTARPYFLGGLGATQFGGVDAEAGGIRRDIDGSTKFSTTWALGVKVNPSPKLGIRLETRWTPTYVKSDAAGYWCDPYWGCYVGSDAQYSNQFEMSGGLTLRF